MVSTNASFAMIGWEGIKLLCVNYLMSACDSATTRGQSRSTLLLLQLICPFHLIHYSLFTTFNGRKVHLNLAGNLKEMEIERPGYTCVAVQANVMRPTANHLQLIRTSRTNSTYSQFLPQLI